MRILLLAGLIVAAALPHGGVRKAEASRPTTFAQAGQAAVGTLLRTYYAGEGRWRACDGRRCAAGNADWGDDSLTYSLALRARLTRDPSLTPVMRALAASARQYPPRCRAVAGCARWSDVPEWDAIALADEYEVTHDPAALSKAEAAFEFVAGTSVYGRGACPAIPYQQPGGGTDHLKTLETTANAVKAGLLLYRATNDRVYLDGAAIAYAAARKYFLDPVVPLYSVYVFDDGHRCRQLPHRFFASVNGDMIWSGIELYRDTLDRTYLRDAVSTVGAVSKLLTDGRGVFVDMQAENDVVEPLVEGMLAAERMGVPFARRWLLTNARAALSARAPDGSYGRFFDGPPPRTATTAWQTNGGLAIEIAAAAIAPRQGALDTTTWRSSTPVTRTIRKLPANLTSRGAGIALVGTLGDHCCAQGHARVVVDGHGTFDATGIWQNKSSSGRRIPRTVLFAWRWSRAGRHTLAFARAVANAKEGRSFLHLDGYSVLSR
jgi:hypothetical protein